MYRRLWVLLAILLIAASPMRAQSRAANQELPAAAANPLRLQLRPEIWRDIKLERVVQAPQTTAAKPSKSRKTLVWVLVAAGAGVGVLLATKGGSSPTETPQPTGSITLGQPTVGTP